MESTNIRVVPYDSYVNSRANREICYKSIIKWILARDPDIDIDGTILTNYYIDKHLLYMAYLASRDIPVYEDLDIPINADQIYTDLAGIILRECEHCGKKFNRSMMYSISDTLYCRYCVEGLIVSCSACGMYHLYSDPEINIYLVDGLYTEWRCSRCRVTNERGAVGRRGYTRDVIGKKEKGTKVHTPRAWSTEIECYLTDPNAFNKRLKKLPANFGIVHDGSLVNDGSRSENNHMQTILEDGRPLAQGIEIQTPILRGKEGEQYLIDICKALNAKDNAQVDNTCGLHIHLDMSDCGRDTPTVQALLIFHWIFEPVLMSFLPANRRANIYCQSIKNTYPIKGLITGHSYATLKNYWYRKTGRLGRFNKKHTRYHGINLHSLFNDGHMEIRYHSGTTNPTKILHWVNLHATIVDYCFLNLRDPKKLTDLIADNLTKDFKAVTLSKLTRQMFECLNLSDECKSYFKDRQKKFHGSTTTFEAEFIEKDKEESEETETKDPDSLQLTLEEYMQKLSELTEMK